MFVFKLFKAYDFTEEEHALALYMVKTFMKHDQYNGAFLNQLPLERVKFKWVDNMSEGVMGAFIPMFWTKNINIYIAANPNPPLEDMVMKAPLIRFSWLFSNMDTVLHEMCHAWQYACKSLSWLLSPVIKYLYPVLYTICAFPILREFTIESDVKENVENPARILFEKIIRDVDHLYFRKRVKFEIDNDEYKYYDKKLAERILNHVEDPSFLINQYKEEGLMK